MLQIQKLTSVNWQDLLPKVVKSVARVARVAWPLDAGIFLLDAHVIHFSLKWSMSLVIRWICCRA